MAGAGGGVKVGSKIRAHWPLFAAMAILWGALAGFLRICIAHDGGQIVYAIDDPYIAMAVAGSDVHGKLFGGAFAITGKVATRAASEPARANSSEN